VSNVIQAIETAVDYGQFPDPAGHFGPYGGRFVPELLIAPLEELSAAYARYRDDAEFRAQLDSDLKYYVGRPTPLYLAERWSNNVGGARIYLKREDLDHTGAHKINNTMGQALLAVRMGKKRIVAETGAGQHGVATAAVCARLGLECIVYMGAEDVRRQSVNVYRMRLMGAKVVPVDSGTRTLKDALNEAFRDWAANVDSTFYIIGTVAGPHPYPEMVRDFQSVIGRETREQCLAEHGRLPDAVVACVGGGSNAIGIFHPFLEDREVAIYGVEAGGDGVETGRHAAPLSAGRPGVLHGNRTYLMENEDGQIMPTHSVSAGLDYPGVGPEHAWLKDGGRVNYIAVNDDAALAAFHSLAQTEGIIPALETAHAIAYAEDLAREMRPDQTIVVNCSGRGDKDINTVAEVEGMTL
jgi:tryptophan synthase beta chain